MHHATDMPSVSKEATLSFLQMCHWVSVKGPNIALNERTHLRATKCCLLDFFYFFIVVSTSAGDCLERHVTIKCIKQNKKLYLLTPSLT